MNITYKIIIGILLLGGAFSTNAEEICSADKRIVNPCYDVYGKLTVHANMRVYLWPVGTKRLIAISYRKDSPEPNPPLPSNIHLNHLLENDLFGNFNICPFTKEKAGKMQVVCINSVSNLSEKKK